jgi:hypothetical protein
MKLFNFIAWTGIGILVAVLACPAHAETEVKRICHEVKGKQVCKNVKVHKKFEGTKVPEKAPVPKKN